MKYKTVGGKQKRETYLYIYNLQHVTETSLLSVQAELDNTLYEHCNSTPSPPVHDTSLILNERVSIPKLRGGKRERKRERQRGIERYRKRQRQRKREKARQKEEGRKGESKLYVYSNSNNNILINLGKRPCRSPSICQLSTDHISFIRTK